MINLKSALKVPALCCLLMSSSTAFAVDSFFITGQTYYCESDYSVFTIIQEEEGYSISMALGYTNPISEPRYCGGELTSQEENKLSFDYYCGISASEEPEGSIEVTPSADHAGYLDFYRDSYEDGGILSKNCFPAEVKRGEVTGRPLW